MKEVVKYGLVVFYFGLVVENFIKDVWVVGLILIMEDFWDYKVVIWKFVVVDIMGFIVISMLFFLFGGVLLVFVSVYCGILIWCFSMMELFGSLSLL